MTTWTLMKTRSTPPALNGHPGTSFPPTTSGSTRAVVADIITSTLRDLDLKFPEVTEAQLKTLAEARKTLEAE